MGHALCFSFLTKWVCVILKEKNILRNGVRKYILGHVRCCLFELKNNENVCVCVLVSLLRERE